MAEETADSGEVVMRLRPWHVVALVACSHLLFAAFAAPVERGFLDWTYLFFLGAWYMQPVLFGQWLAIGPGRFWMRFQLTVLTFALLIALGRVEPDSNLEREDVAIRLAEFLVTVVVMWMLRALLHWRISHGTLPVNSDESTVQSSVKSLLVWTAFWAVFLVLARFIWTHSEHSISMRLEEIAIGTSIFALVFGPPGLVAVVFLATEWISGLAAATAIIWVVAAVILMLIAVNLTPIDPDAITTILLVSCGATLAACLSALPLRFAGYRLMSRGSRNERAIEQQP